MEIWKDIEGYEGVYQVSNYGRIKSFLGKEKVLKPVLNNAGYCQYSLRGKRFLVHRLVGKCFLDNPNDYTIINHIDNNPLNNHFSNLEWCTYSKNQLHANKTGSRKCGSGNYNATITEKQVIEVVKLLRFYKPMQVSKLTSISPFIIYNIKKGASWNQVTGLPRVRFYKIKKAA